ncbi:endolytic transglycosylase MltG [Paenibacillus sp. TRM 82003]|uniref:endolytic transglycosylase MltG n=1 Tax=Kineococcus sp. TRM81007 TaxID=2925831 RepID=UPI001F595E4A|nr:endolytic transglycosylase MltG [Kineococcus sp. TRM81007]MCI2239001.1 endolytic transglycosylase MltG [Kineococcus sp. TRM81007]MCI3924421.1 endolytic transglycosylase MltG [Paenibacillus sp. TRM 82003]
MDLMDLPGTREGRPRRRRPWRAVVVLLVALGLVGGGTWAAWGTLEPLVSRLTASDDYEGTGTGSVDVKVEAGDTGTAIGRTLQEAGVVKTTEAFISAASAHPGMAGIQPGTYRLKQEMSASAAVALLMDPASKVTTRLTVPEGLRVTQVVELIGEQTPLSTEDVEAALADPAAIGLPASAGGNAEGYLFPATYEVDPDETAVELLSSMVARTQQALTELGVAPEREREVIITASIAQKEARSAADMAKVTRVLLNRIEDGMKLQLDSTVSYGTGGTTVTTTADERATDTPWNTYMHEGLPAGPISNPGMDALRAAVNPEPGPWKFFVTVDLATGETRFAETGAEHAANVELFRQYLREHPESE